MLYSELLAASWVCLLFGWIRALEVERDRPRRETEDDAPRPRICVELVQCDKHANELSLSS